MKRMIAFIMLVAVFAVGMYQPARAGGSPFQSLAIIRCNFWEASGAGGQVTPNWLALYVVTDGLNTVLAQGTLTDLSKGLVGNYFGIEPKQNPIHFIAIAYYQRSAYIIGDLTADSPCLPPAGQGNPTPTPPLPTSVPPVVVTPTPIKPLSTPTIDIGCSQTTVRSRGGAAHAAYTRITVSLASNLSVMLAERTIPDRGQGVDTELTYPTQPAGTRLIVAIGPWNGEKFITPAALYGGDCH